VDNNYVVIRLSSVCVCLPYTFSLPLHLYLYFIIRLQVHHRNQAPSPSFDLMPSFLVDTGGTSLMRRRSCPPSFHARIIRPASTSFFDFLIRDVQLLL
jgi:hypothetical protein